MTKATTALQEAMLMKQTTLLSPEKRKNNNLTIHFLEQQNTEEANPTPTGIVCENQTKKRNCHLKPKKELKLHKTEAE